MMERYRSGGAATIAALMAVGQISRRCERAVVAAYRDLHASGTDEPLALEACTTLYRIHHPEASPREAKRLVAEWIDHYYVRGEHGPTPGCDCED